MNQQLRSYSIKNGILYGSVAGFISGIIMMMPMSYFVSEMGMSYELMLQAMGAMLLGSTENAFIELGLTAHFITSTSIGLIFGIIVSKVNRFKISNYPKGIVEGVLAGMIAFIVLSIPISTIFMQPFLSDLILQTNPNMTEEMLMSAINENMSYNIASSLAYHLVFGFFLGLITTMFVMRHKPIITYKN